MRYEIRRAVLIVILAILIVFSAVPGTAQERERPDNSDCSRTSTGAIPLDDLGEDSYQGAQGGLYASGSNVAPSDHIALGLFQASQIASLDSSGIPDPNGAIVFVSIGVSNTRMEFGDFMTIASGVTADDVVLVNAAQPGKPISVWVNADDRSWTGVDAALRKANVTGEQVQAAWIKIPERIDSFDELEPFPTDAETYTQDLIQVIRIAKDRYPNLRVAYLSSRIYGGYDPNARPNPEPLAYQNGFGVKWTIDEQIAGSPELNADPRKGDVEAPWIAWGPYIWADGAIPRSDGLVWECADFQGDGTHPTEVGRRKVAIMLLDHFLADPTSSPWFSSEGVQIEDIALPPLIEGITTSTSTSTPPPTTVASVVTTIASTTTSALTSTTASEELVEAQVTTTRPKRRAEDSRSTDPASATLILITVVLVLAVIAGVIGLVARSRNGKGESRTTGADRPEG